MNTQQPFLFQEEVRAEAERIKGPVPDKAPDPAKGRNTGSKKKPESEKRQ
jgi:hypothetical protein